MNTLQLKEDLIEDIAYKLKYGSLSCKDLLNLSKAFNLITQIDIKQDIKEKLIE